ncbi:LPXTG cell wall anchor domain-containing protein [Neobacillus rhizophilus]|uniref:LPXTG cell wall anchor domain-containing protein n=1 Tax=Neobacillus rhizophilus TaxID=2833579 RepID=A0A942U3J1_9BACI|nr:LPXTG cell wall anchor domain-containing protein [Neobacillus rhizophilus]MBS4210934.1 LPXTG cell wall anchor domain-containing protein [Neobacillus rhizophilus]
MQTVNLKRMLLMASMYALIFLLIIPASYVAANGQGNGNENGNNKGGQQEGNNGNPNNGHQGDQDQKGNKSTEIHFHLKNDCREDVVEVYVLWKGVWTKMEAPGNSPNFKLKDNAEYVTDDITAFKLVIKDREPVIIPVRDVRVGVEANGTINYWQEKCYPPPPPPPPGDDDHGNPGDNPGDKPGDNPGDKPGDNPGDKPGDKPGDSDNPNQPGPNPGGTDNNTPPPQNQGNQIPPAQETIKQTTTTGVLPKTGESSPFGYYLLGLLVTASGVYLLRRKKLNN